MLYDVFFIDLLMNSYKILTFLWLYCTTKDVCDLIRSLCQISSPWMLLLTWLCLMLE